MPQYTRNPPLLESDLAADPLAQLAAWLEAAQAAGLFEPTAMTLATVGSDGRPSARIVLYKGPHEGGLTFYTNYGSRKAAELPDGAPAALVFWWDKLERSVRVEGHVRKVPRALSEQYFHSRPRLSQLSAHASRQSRVAVANQCRVRDQPGDLSGGCGCTFLEGRARDESERLVCARR